MSTSGVDAGTIQHHQEGEAVDRAHPPPGAPSLQPPLLRQMVDNGDISLPPAEVNGQTWTKVLIATAGDALEWNA